MEEGGESKEEQGSFVKPAMPCLFCTAVNLRYFIHEAQKRVIHSHSL